MSGNVNMKKISLMVFAADTCRHQIFLLQKGPEYRLVLLANTYHLFLLNVFQTVQSNCDQNDDTGEYELQVRIDT